MKVHFLFEQLLGNSDKLYSSVVCVPVGCLLKAWLSLRDLVGGQPPQLIKWKLFTKASDLVEGKLFTKASDLVEGKAELVSCLFWHKVWSPCAVRFTIIVTLKSLKTKGIDYYNKIIDDLLTNGVTPIVTLYHFDLPQALEDQGGWLSEAIIDSFDKYAWFCFSTFGDRVKHWITINEPNMLALVAYELGAFPPGVPQVGTKVYQAAHNLIKAHARSWHSYDSLFRKEQKGMVSLSIFAGWVEPADLNSVSDQEATKRAIAFQLDFFAKPIFIDGDYPEVVKSQVALMSKKQGYPSSRLPEFTEEEKKMIRGTADFFAVQYYTTRLVKYQESKKGELGLLQDAEVKVFPDSSWINLDWVYVVPWGIRKLLKYIKETYNNPVIYITENGFPLDEAPSFDDTQRWECFRQTFQELLKAKTNDVES
ncbi:cytosolic beta-glucosidase [Camelus ferus]|nr:cytosolic beta-glucosidase [Camelus ferus]